MDIRIVAPLVPLGALSACLVDGTRGFGRRWPYLAIEGLGKPAARIILVLCALLAGLGLHGAVVGLGHPGRGRPGGRRHHLRRHPQIRGPGSGHGPPGGAAAGSAALCCVPGGATAPRSAPRPASAGPGIAGRRTGE